jgi:hypothetical protein
MSILAFVLFVGVAIATLAVVITLWPKMWSMISP